MHSSYLVVGLSHLSLRSKCLEFDNFAFITPLRLTSVEGLRYVQAFPKPAFKL